MKKLTAFLLAVLLLLLCGCQNNNQNTDNGKQPIAGSLAAKFENIHYRSEYHTVSGTAYMDCYVGRMTKFIIFIIPTEERAALPQKFIPAIMMEATSSILKRPI